MASSTFKTLRTCIWFVCVILWFTAVAAAGSSRILDAFSLPNMIDLLELPKGWQLSDNAVLQDGRVILTPQKHTRGQLWLPTFAVSELLVGDNSHNSDTSDGSFTMEWVFRSINFNDISPSSLNFYMILDDLYDTRDHSLANGPSKFNGLSLMINNNGKFADSISAIINNAENTITQGSIDQMAFTQCLLDYQDSAVPITLRLSYNPSDNHLLKLQIDNRVCFQTRKIKLWDTLRDDQRKVKFGVTANNADTVENFEILRVKLFHGLNDATQIPNVKQLPQPIVVRKSIDKTTGMEKTTLRDQFEIKHKDLNNYHLWKKLDLIEGKLLASDINSMIEKLDELTKYQDTLYEELVELSNNFASQKDVSQLDSINEFDSFMKINDKLSQLLTEQEKIRDMNKHSSSTNKIGHYSPHEVVKKLLYWISPFVILLFIMAYHTFRIKQELSNTKRL